MFDLLLRLIWSHLTLHTDLYIWLLNIISSSWDLLFLHANHYMRLIDVVSWNIMFPHLSLDLFEDCLIDLRQSVCFAFYLLVWCLLRCCIILWEWISISNTTIFTGCILNWLHYSWIFEWTNSSRWSLGASIL